MTLLLAACQIVPGHGPLAGNIVGAAGQSSQDLQLPSVAVFELVEIDSSSALLVSAYQSQALNRRFGFGGRGGSAVIGVGDQLLVTIFEAGTDGLFSTIENKQTQITLVVQPDGTAAIPYVGSVRFAGRTLEQARQTILAALRGRAVEPDVIISTGETPSRSVTVSGTVGAPGQIPIGLSGDQLTESIAKAGGPSAQPYETYVTLVRGGKTGRALLKSIIENPSENVHVQPGDQIFLTRDPRTFTVLGEAVQNNRIEFGANDLNLLEAIALAGGGMDSRVSHGGYFIFRYEEQDIIEALVGKKRFEELFAKGMAPDRNGRFPVVYRIDMSRADSLFIGQNFPVNSRDVIYMARHPSVDLVKFLTMLGAPLGIAATVNSF